MKHSKLEIQDMQSKRRDIDIFDIIEQTRIYCMYTTATCNIYSQNGTFASFTPPTQTR